MKIYLAGRITNRAHLVKMREQLQAAGHIITSRWLMGDSGDRQAMAVLDIADVDMADALILWPDPGPDPTKPGKGMYVEFGYAVAKGKAVYVVEPHPHGSIFAELPMVTHFKDWTECLKHFNK